MNPKMEKNSFLICAKPTLVFITISGDIPRLVMFLQPGFTDPLPTIYLGRLNDDETLALAYSAADVMVVPSLQDNLPNTAVEAIAFGTGGMV